MFTTRSVILTEFAPLSLPLGLVVLGIRDVVGVGIVLDYLDPNTTSFGQYSFKFVVAESQAPVMVCYSMDDRHFSIGRVQNNMNGNVLYVLARIN